MMENTSPGVTTRRLWLGALLALIGVGGTGCKMMTDGQLARLEKEERRQQAVAQGITKTEAKTAEDDEKRRQLSLRIKNNEASRARRGQFDEANTLLGQQKAEEALALIDAVFAADADAKAAYDAKLTEDPSFSGFLARPVETPEPATPEPGAPADPNAAPPKVEEEVIPKPMEPRERATFFVLRGAALYSLGRPEEGLASFEQATTLDPSNRPARINFGKLLFSRREYRRALDIWQREFEDGFRSADLLFYSGQALYELGRENGDEALIEAARTALLEALVSRSNDPELFRWLGQIEYETGRYEMALRYFKGVLEKTPLDLTYMEFIGNCHLELGDLRSAADQFEMIARVSKKPSTEICKALFGIYLELKLHDRAALWLRRAYEGQPMPTSDRLELAYQLLESERPEEAIAEFDTIPEGAREYAEAQGTAADLELQLGRNGAAARRLERVMDLEPEDGRVRIVAATIQMEEKNFTAAARYFSQAAGIPETKARGYAGVAEAYYEMGDLGRAIDNYREAIEADPENASYRFALKEIQAEKQFQDEAKTGR